MQNARDMVGRKKAHFEPIHCFKYWSRQDVNRRSQQVRMTSFPIYFVFLTVLMFGPKWIEKSDKSILNSRLRLIKLHCMNTLYAGHKHDQECWNVEKYPQRFGVFFVLPPKRGLAWNLELTCGSGVHRTGEGKVRDSG